MFTVPSSIFHILIVKSYDALAKRFFSSKSSALIAPECPEKVFFTVASFTFHSLIVLSDDPLTMFPFGSSTRENIVLVWPENVFLTFPMNSSAILN